MNNIRWGILSTANIAGAMIKGIRETSNGEVRAVASRSMEKAQNYAHEKEIPTAYGSYEELLQDPEIDAIYNPLPVNLHAEWSIRAMEAGKPVLCEKPMALNADEVKAMTEASEKHGVLLSESLMYVYHPLTVRFLELLKEGRIGEIQNVRALFHAQINEGNIRLSKATGGGAMLDVGSYCTSVMRHMAGEEPDAVKAVATYNDDGVDLLTSGVLHFPSGITGHFSCGLTAAFDCTYAAYGTEGVLRVDRGAMCAWPGEEFKIAHVSGDGTEEITVPAGNAYALIAEDFARALLTGEPMRRVSLDDTLRNLAVIDRVLANTRNE